MREASKTIAMSKLTASKLPVLFVDDEPLFLHSASITLRSSGIKQVFTLEDARQVSVLMAEQEPGVVVLDLRMPHLTGDALLEQINTDYPDIPVIILTAIDDLSTAVECMKKGAFDYLVKPVERNRLVAAVKRALEMRALRDEVLSLKKRLLSDSLEHAAVFADIVTQNRVMQAIFRYVEAISVSEQPVLITGETGTGKELIARAVHRLSRPNGEFVAVNVAGLDDTVFTDTLFGHRKGAFTGAEKSRDGLIAAATGGTLFLDEVGDLQETAQVKLLRLIQEHNYYPLGADQPRQTNARIVVATNTDVSQMLSEGRFRKDLFYRLRNHHIHIPPLRDRKDDLPLLLSYFLERSAETLKKSTPKVPSALFNLLAAYHFPGNVRELEAMVHDSVTRHQGGILSLKSFKDVMEYTQTVTDEDIEGFKGNPWPVLFSDRLPTLKEAEQILINEALRRANGNQGVAAEYLGLTRQALNKRLLRSRQGDSSPLLK